MLPSVNEMATSCAVTPTPSRRRQPYRSRRSRSMTRPRRSRNIALASHMTAIGAALQEREGKARSRGEEQVDEAGREIEHHRLLRGAHREIRLAHDVDQRD